MRLHAALKSHHSRTARKSRRSSRSRQKRFSATSTSCATGWACRSIRSATVRLLLLGAGHRFSEHRSFRRRNHRALRRAKGAGAIQGNAFRTSAAFRFPEDHGWPERSRLFFLDRSGECHFISQRRREPGRSRTFRNREQSGAAVRRIGFRISETARAAITNCAGSIRITSVAWRISGTSSRKIWSAGSCAPLRLPRMRDVSLTTKGFHRPADFSISKILSGSFGAHSGRKHRIRLLFDPSRRGWLQNGPGTNRSAFVPSPMAQSF